MRKSFRSGFTLVEVALSTAFVGILSIAIVLIINDTVAAYRRGLVLSQVNTTGMDVVDDLRTAVQNSSARSVTNDCTTFYSDRSTIREQCEKDGAYNFISVTRYADVTVLNELEKNVPIYGAFCTGTYSYIWNSGYFESSQATFADKNNWATLKYLTGVNEPCAGEESVNGNVKTCTIKSTTRKTTFGSVNTGKPFRLLKVKDDNRAVCSSVVRWNGTSKSFIDNYNLPYDGKIDPNFDITGYGVLEEEPVDLILSDNENDLAIYELLVARPAESTTRFNTFYSVSFILGTIDGGINIRSSGQSCSPPADWANENFDYCAINKFNFAIQANGER